MLVVFMSSEKPRLHAGHEVLASDLKLTQLAAQGDKDAAEKLGSLAFNRGLIVGRSMLLPEAVAEDIGSETRLKALRLARSFKGGSPLIFWLHRVAARKAYDFLNVRRNQELPVSQLSTELRKEFDSLLSDDPDDLRSSVNSQAIRSAVLRLKSQPAREAISAFLDYPDCPHDELAKMLGINPVTFRTRLHTARMSLSTDPVLFKELFG